MGNIDYIFLKSNYNTTNKFYLKIIHIYINDYHEANKHASKP